MRREHSLQIAVAHMLELVLDPERTWWSAIDHAAQLSPRYGADRRRRGVKPGLPDFVVMWIPCGDVNNGMIGLELKSGKGRLSRSQEEVSEAWDRMCHSIYVPRSLEDVQEILEACGVPLRRRMNLFSKEAKHEQPALRPQTPRHKRPPRRRRPAGAVPVVLGDT